MNFQSALVDVRALPSGDYAECGVWKGHSAKYINAAMADGATFYIFDSFQGHQAPGPFDDAAARPEGRYRDTDEASIQALLPDAVIIPGYIPATLDAVADKRFRFVNIDVDHYAPTKAAIEFFKPRMVKGGIMRFDDSGSSDCPGATKAVKETIGWPCEFYVREV